MKKSYRNNRMADKSRRKIARVATNIFEILLGRDRFESILVRLCRIPRLRRYLKLGSLAYAYAAKQEGAPTRLAFVEKYNLYVHLKNPLGVKSYFFGESGAFPLMDLLLKPDCTFLDAGANIGQFSAKATDILNGKGRVYAFEPDPNNRKLLEQTVEENGWNTRLKVSSRALWKVSHSALKFYPSQSAENTGTSSLVHHGVHQDTSKFIEVRTVTLDDFVEEESISRIRLLKIDVERAEHELLQGFQKGLARNIVDFILIEMEGRGPAMNLLKQNGYSGFKISAGQLARRIGTEEDGKVSDFLLASPSNLETIRTLSEAITEENF